MSDADAATYHVKLDVFEGPFQLLLALIAEHRLDVCDIPISRLCQDYLAHLEAMERSDLEVTTEFLVVAATLLALKAKAILPRQGETAPDEEERIERDLLIARLLEVQTFRTAGEHLAARLAEGDRRYPSAPAPDDDALRQLPLLADLEAPDLARLLVDMARDRARSVDTSRIVVDPVSTQDAAAEIVRVLDAGPVRFGDLARGRTRAWTVALFLAMLELAMRGEIVLGEGTMVGEIELSLVGGK